MAYLPESPEELADVIGDAVRAAVAEAVPPAVRAATRKPYLTTAELSEMTGWSPRTIYSKRQRREIPSVRQGRTILYPTDEVEAHLREGYVSAKKGA